MKKWYQSAFCKGILILLAHVSIAFAVVCAMVGIGYPGQNYEDLFSGKTEKSYNKTIGFAHKMQTNIEEVLDIIYAEDTLSKDGEIQPDEVIDIEKYPQKLKNAKEQGELSFRLNNLVRNGNREEYVIVGEKPEGEMRYQYFQPEEFVQFVKENDYQFLDEDYSEETVLSMIEEENSLPSETELHAKDGKIIYSGIWFLEKTVSPQLKTADGKTLLDVANTSEKWNGKLSDLIGLVDDKIGSIIDDYENYEYRKEEYREGNTNVSYLFANYDTKVLKTNRKEYQDIKNVENSVRKMADGGKYIMIAPTLEECSTNLEAKNVDLSTLRHRISATLAKNEDFVFVLSVDTNYPISDTYYMQNKAYTEYIPWINKVIAVGGISLVIFIISVIWLTAVAGRSNNEKGLALLFYDKWKTEIGLAAIAALIVGAIALGASWAAERFFNQWNLLAGLSTINTTPVRLAEGAVVSLGVCAVVLTAYLSLVRRIKAKTLWKNSILRRIVQLCAYVYRNRSSVTKAIIVAIVLFLINLSMMSGAGVLIIFAVAVDLLAMAILIKYQIEKQKIKTGIMRISAGEVEYKIPLEKMKGDNREMAEAVNNIGEGIQNAVEKSMKDERLKTDLITNVSHDIKTPLTSIINYVGLLKQEEFTDPKIERYLEVLDEKSQRLKILTEDVVEASKISSGNISLEMNHLNLVELVHQTAGEFAEKFEKRELELVLTVPETPVIIRADGRRMWRVLSNIYNNASKYAMCKTRVYADIKADGREVIFSLKNISEQPLNINADELTERFIRGDVSRSTEGSGLGLSIAQNLTEMQGGQFKLYVDGDLFKVTITFPQVTPETGIVK